MPSTIMKQVLLEVMLKHTKGREEIRDCQQGINKGKSCLTNLVAFCNGVTASVEKGRVMHVIYFDICKTLDMVLHNILASKLDIWV